MARKRFVFLSTVESFVLKLVHQFKSEVIFRRWGYRRLVVLLLLGVFLFTAAIPPVLSQMSNTNANNLSVEQVSQLVKQSRQHYENGEFEKAIESLQQAAKNFEKQKDWGNLASTLSNLGLSQLELGQSSAAFKSWEEAEKYFARIKNQPGITKSRVYQAQALQSLGLYSRACELLTTAVLDNPLQCDALDEKVNTGNKDRSNWDLLTSAIKEEDKSIQAIIWHSLGDVLRVIGDLDNSIKALKNGLEIAESLSSSKYIPSMHLSLGNTLRAKGNLERDRRSSPLYEYIPWLYDVEQQKERQKIDEAKGFYNEAIEHYKSAIKNSTSQTAPKSSLKLQAQLNYLSLLIETGDILTAQTLSSEIYSIENDNFQIELSSKLTGIYAKVNLAKSLAFLKQASEKNKSWEKAPSWDEVIKLIKASQQEAKDLKSKRGQSYALGNLGGLYEHLGRVDEAQQITQEALYLAQPSELPDIAYQWQWQMGRLLKAQSNQREEAIASYEAAVKTLESVRGDLLAINADVQFSFRDNVEPVYRNLVDLLLQNPTQNNLDKARNFLQKLQKAELESLLKCSLQSTQQVIVDNIVDRRDSTEAVIYPIVLQKRVELILKLPNTPELRHKKIDVDSKEVNEILEQLQKSLPEPDAASQIQIASQKLYKWIIDPIKADLESSKVNTLVFLLDAPLRNIPMGVLHDGKDYLIQKYAIATTSGLQLFQPKYIKPGSLKILLVGLTKIGSNSSLLEKVKLQFDKIKSEIPSKVLIDEDFTIENLQSQINSSSFPIVHFATHGEFSSKPGETFIAASNEQRIDIPQLSQLLQRQSKARPEPIELLVLAACETATGDNRATLGLAGAAVKAGARSTLATLWKVDANEYPGELMSKFYSELNKGVTKAKALQIAQLEFIKDDSDRKIPRSWAAYVMIENWL